MQDVAVERMGDKNSLFGHNMRVLRGAFSDDAITRHPRIVGTLRDGFILHQRSVKQLRGLDICPAPSQVGQSDYLDASSGRRIVSQRTALRERQYCRRCIDRWKYEIAVGRRAARDLPIYHALLNTVARHQVAADCEPSVRVRRALYSQFPK